MEDTFPWKKSDFNLMTTILPLMESMLSWKKGKLAGVPSYCVSDNENVV
jgi:hypothetical protein